MPPHEPAHVLLVEDETDLSEILAYHLKREGFMVTSTADGHEAVRMAREERPGVVLLDLMIEGLPGLRVCELIKSDPALAATRVIIVSARDTEEDVLVGLVGGADDYVRKPFRPKEVIARVRTVLRRTPPIASAAANEEILRFEPIVLNHARREVSVNGALLTLTATEYRLLYFLMLHPGRVFTRGQLLAQAAEAKSSVTGRNIDVHIRALRGKLGPHADLISTSRGVGYRFSPTPTHSGLVS